MPIAIQIARFRPFIAPSAGTILYDMIADIDLWRAAKALLDRYGEDASIEAAMRADEMLEQGDMDGKVVWLRILEAVEKLQNTEPTGPMH